jgi:hypothetical protein
MATSIAAAKNRRAGIKPNTPPMPTNAPNQPPAQPAGLTLPQVIAVIDQRLITLEKFMNDNTVENDPSIPNLDENGEDQTGQTGIVMDSKEFNTFVDEINNRFQMLAEEINTLKDTVMKLQAYTMDVNKVLLSEITKNEGGEMPAISLGENENVKYILESMQEAENETPQT